MKTRIERMLLTLTAAWMLSACFTQAQEERPVAKAALPVVTGDKIAFLGDSITYEGINPTWRRIEGGYCRLVLDGLKKHGVEATGICAAYPGWTSNDMRKALERSVIGKKPNWMTLSCGVNDVWKGAKGVNLEDYKKNITEIVEKVQAAGIKVMILTATMIGEDQKNPNNQKLVSYNEFLRTLAKEKGCLLADLNADMQEALKTFPANARGNKLTRDGVHMNALGNIMMAKGVLKAFGLTDEELKDLEKEWSQPAPEK